MSNLIVAAAIINDVINSLGIAEQSLKEQIEKERKAAERLAKDLDMEIRSGENGN